MSESGTNDGRHMRLTGQQRTIIRATVAETFGAGADVWLFGSRVDDNKRGGDIDLLKLKQIKLTSMPSRGLK